MLRVINVEAFVDWQAQIANAKQLGETRDQRRIENTVEYVVDAISKYLDNSNIADLFTVDMRLYYGWIAGLTKTSSRRIMGSLLLHGSLPSARLRARFNWHHPFGDELLSALEHRRHPKLKVHLPDTLRENLEGGGRIREKMVDTALICDLLVSARTSPTDWRVVMAEDDDLVPGVFVSESWSKDSGGRTILMRRRQESRHLQLNGLLWNMEQ